MREGSDPAKDAGAALLRLVDVTARLRDPDSGCAWDRAQDSASIMPYTIEEAYEVADAVARGDTADLADELGDLQYQIVFHARIAAEAGHFTLADVIDGIVAKMIRRHPGIFGGTVDEPADWETIKATERTAKSPAGALAGVALGLPALMRAEKLQRRAARVGFDWPDASGPRAKVDEELAEVEATTNVADRAEEYGDLLFALVNWGRHLGIDAETALSAANRKFERRFAGMEALASGGFTSLSTRDKDALWRVVKTKHVAAIL